MRAIRNLSFLALIVISVLVNTSKLRADCTADIFGTSQLHEDYTDTQAMERCMEWSDCEDDCIDQCGMFDPPPHFFSGCDDADIFPTYWISWGSCICTTEH